MAKPTELPEWASGGGADITDPPSGKKSTGWIVEKPAHDFFNWILNTIYKWTQWEQTGVKRTRQILTGSGTYTKPADVTSILVRGWGGGGGGGGCAITAGNPKVTVSGGGASGGYAELLIASPAGTYSFACGAAGTGGTINGDGVAGGDTTFGTGPLLRAKGGQGGPKGAQDIDPADDEWGREPGGIPIISGGIGDFVTYGESGGTGFAGRFSNLPAAIAMAGIGASSEVGTGGNPFGTTTGQGHASGGAGTTGNGTSGNPGFDGSSGLIIVEEYY